MRAGGKIGFFYEGEIGAYSQSDIFYNCLSGVPLQINICKQTK